HGAGANLLFRARGFIDIGNTADQALVVHEKLTRHGARNDLQLAGLHRRENHRLARCECRRRVAAAPALSAIVAGQAAVDALRQHRHARRDDRNVQLLAGALHQHFMNARRNRWQEVAIRRAANTFMSAGDAHESFGLVIPGRHFFISHWPVEAEAVELLGLEIVIGEAQRDASVVIGAAAENARTEPAEFTVRRDGVRLAGHVPVAIWRVPVAPLLLAEIRFGVGAAAAVVYLPGPDVFLEILHGIEHGPGFEKRDVDPEISQHFYRGAAAGAGADYDNVMHLWGTLNLEHG